MRSILVRNGRGSIVGNVIPNVMSNLFRTDACNLPPYGGESPGLSGSGNDSASPNRFSFEASCFAPSSYLTTGIGRRSNGVILAVLPGRNSVSLHNISSRNHFFRILNSVNTAISSVSTLS